MLQQTIAAAAELLDGPLTINKLKRIAGSRARRSASPSATVVSDPRQRWRRVRGSIDSQHRSMCEGDWKGSDTVVALQNRVNPLGEIVAVPHRGTMLGNRGKLHDENRTIVRHSQLDRWLCCQLSFRGRKRTVMAPRRYTELFFLDEATALAAGHRPCAECRYRSYQRFRAAWRDAGLAEQLPAAPRIDAQLARERGRQLPARLADLSDGTLVLSDGHPHLLWRHQLWRWDWTGYHSPATANENSQVQALTPESTIKTIQAGYPPTVHPTATR